MATHALLQMFPPEALGETAEESRYGAAEVLATGTPAELKSFLAGLSATPSGCVPGMEHLGRSFRGLGRGF